MILLNFMHCYNLLCAYTSSEFVVPHYQDRKINVSQTRLRFFTVPDSESDCDPNCDSYSEKISMDVNGKGIRDLYT